MKHARKAADPASKALGARYSLARQASTSVRLHPNQVFEFISVYLRRAIAEAALRRLGFGDSRVRHHGDIARLELPLGDLARAAGPLREAVHDAVRAAGFRHVVLDLAGIQSGAFTRAATR